MAIPKFTAENDWLAKLGCSTDLLLCKTWLGNTVTESSYREFTDWMKPSCRKNETYVPNGNVQLIEQYGNNVASCRGWIVTNILDDEIAAATCYLQQASSGKYIFLFTFLKKIHHKKGLLARKRAALFVVSSIINLKIKLL